MADKIGAAFGVYPSSGRRPERLNQSRNVNAPLQLARGWTAGLLGLPGDIEGLVRMLPGIENETPVLPTSDFYREYLPGYDPAPAARAISGLGALAGGVGATKVAGAGVKGAKAAGKALGPKAAEMAESYLQKSGLAPTVVKPKGGNWLSGSVEGATQPLKRGVVDEAAVRRLMGDEFADERLADPIDNAVNNWIDTKLNKYIRNEMGTPEDPVRKLAERDVLHVDPEQVGVNRWKAPNVRQAQGYPKEGLGQSEAAKAWEAASDVSIFSDRAGDISKGYPLEIVEANPWLSKLDPSAKVHELDAPSARGLGFDHLIDELRNATRADSDLPANLRWKPEDLKKVTMEQAVERVAKINEYRAAKKAEANEVLARNPATMPYKDYETVPGTQEPNQKGLAWKQIRAAEMPEGFVPPERYEIVRPTPSSETLAIRDRETGKYITTGLKSEEQARKHLSETLSRKQLEDALKYEGDVMGHCVGGYCDDVLEGRSQIYSLRDKKGEPHVTIETIPGRPWNQRSGIFYEYPELESPWAAFSKEVNAAARAKGVDRDPNYIIGFPDWLAQNQPEIFAKYQAIFQEPPAEIVQIKGKGNAAPKAEYLPFVQDFVRSGNWSKVGDLKNTGLIKLGDQYLPKEEVGPLVERASRFIEETPALREHREAQRAYENYSGPVPSAEYTALQRAAGKQVHPTIPYTYRELRAILDDPDAFADRNTDALAPNLERIERLRQLVGEQGYAKGGLVEDTDAIAAKLTGMDKDKALTQALRMANSKQEAYMAAGGLAKLLKGAKKTEEAAKASSKAHPTVFPPASPLTQAEMRPIAQRIAEQMTEEFVRPNPKLSKNPAGKTRKTFEREKDLPVETVQRIEPKPSPVMDYEQMQGGYLVGVPGDPTLGGVAKPGTLESVHQGAVELRRLGDVEFGQNPTGRVQLFGGPRYGSFADDEHFWASNLGPAQAIQNRATELGEFGPVYGQYIKMAPPSTNFAEHNLDALLAYQQPEKLSKSKMELLNKAVREGSPKYGKFPGFAGFEDPIDVLLQAQMNSDLRKHIAETLMKPDTTNALGLRPGSDVLFGISVPELRNLETGVSGYSIGKLEPGVELMPSLHPTYDYDIPGLFLGQSKYPVPYEVAFPRSTAYTRANLKPGAQEFNTLKMIGAREKIDPQYIDQIKMYEELMKEYTGKKEGGAVEPEGAEDFIRQVNAKIANKPVSAEDGYRIPY